MNSPKHQLLILSRDYEAYLHLLEAAGLPGLSIHATHDTQEALVVGTQCDLLLSEPSLVSKVINQLPRLTWVQTTWAGVENLVSLGMRRNYLLTNARGVYGPMMSEYVFGYLLAIERQIIPRWQAQQAGKWDATTPGSLRGKWIGLCGVGTIGAHLAATARHFNMHVFGYTLKRETCPDIDQYYHAGDWQKFASDLDYLVCTLPGTHRTKGLVSSTFLAALPRKAWLINVGRGSTVDETALIQALSARAIAGAVLDVFNEEPLPADHALWSTPNTFITSHTAARNYLPDIAALFIDNYKRYVDGRPLLYQVDFDQGY
ncbi:MAG TPA: D-2-hydroxyacid dehydrogenase [Anaerolineales bacterium]|nr:D-2-hydroxyacid dehydrogenase [Anaerolineales bacterium]